MGSDDQTTETSSEYREHRALASRRAALTRALARTSVTANAEGLLRMGRDPWAQRCLDLGVSSDTLVSPASDLPLRLTS